MRVMPLLAIVLSAVCAPLQAAVITVNTPHDQFGETPSECSLREAVQAANTDTAFGGCIAGFQNDVIRLPVRPGGNVNYRLTRTGGDEDDNETGDLDIRSLIAIQGLAGTSLSGPGDLTPDMVEVECRVDRCFQVFSGGSLQLRDLTISGGDVTGLVGKDGGLILRQFAGILDLDDVVLREGRARWGGAVYEIGSGTTAMDNVAILDNRADVGGGWFHNGNSTAAITNVTFSGNIAADSGGAMRVNAPANLRHVTVTGNGSLSSGNSGGFEYTGPGNTGINIYNSVFAGNWSGSGSPGSSNDMFCFAGIGVRSHVFVQRGNCTFQSTTGPALTGEARLAPLFDYGSGIPTHALLDGSPLIDAAGNGAGNAACRVVDARGVPRPANDCDIGAYERVFNHVVNASGDFPDANPGNGVCATSNGQCTLRAAVQEAARLTTPQTIRVPPGTYSVTGMQDGYSAIWGIGSSDPRAITLVGDIDAPESVVIAVTGLGGAFEVSGLLTASDVEYRATPALALMGLTIQDANRPEGSVNFPELGGAIRVDGGNLLVYRSILRNNRVPRGNGGAIGVDRRFETSRRRMVAIVEESSLLDNDAIGGSQGEGGNGGAIAAPLSGIFLSRPTLIVRNSTFSGNEATNRGGAIFGSGRVLFSTISGNRALRGGGVYRSGPADNVLSLGNSIVHGNALNSGVTPFGPDCAVDPNGGVTPIVSYGYNLIGNATDCTRSGEPALDIVNAAPQLNALRGDLGPTPVFFPLPTSAAVDAIPGTRCVDFADGTRLRFDQNGDLRQGTFSTVQCFIGAVEGAAAPPADPVFADGFEAPP